MSKVFRTDFKLLRKTVIFLILLVVSSCALSEPFDEVVELLDSGGGTRTGNSNKLGYYVVSLAMSEASTESEGFERARIEALRQLTEVINGVTIDGMSKASLKHVTVGKNNSRDSYSHEEFINVAQTRFAGHLSAIKLLKKGVYGDSYFVAMSIAEFDIAAIGRLRTVSTPTKSHSSKSGQVSTNHTMSSFTNQGSKIIEAKGLASMKHGEQKAREQALQEALRNAVQQAQGVMLKGKSGMYNDSIAMALSTKTQGYVSSYKLLDEDIERGNYYVIIVAEVDSSKLLNDVNFYLGVLSQPVFSVVSSNGTKTLWITDELERLGFSINDGRTKPTHVFSLEQNQSVVENNRGRKGIETRLSLQLKDNETGDIVLTVTNNPTKSRIYVNPEARARQVSEHAAYKYLKKIIGREIIQSLAANAERGIVYTLVLKDARRTDLELFKHVFNNGTDGSIEGWNWKEKGKVLTLKYRYAGSLSDAMDEGLSRLYKTYKQENIGRRPHAQEITRTQASFKMVSR